MLFLGVLYALGLLPNAGTLMTGLAAGCIADPAELLANFNLSRRGSKP